MRGVSIAVALTAAVLASGASAADGPFAGLWSMHGDGSARRLVAVLPEMIVARTADHIAYFGADGLVVARLDGTGAVTIPEAYGYAVFSPSGASILYTTTDRGGHDVHVARTDGTRSRLLARSAGPPSWSPDGQAVYFNSGAPGARSDVVTEHPDGTGRRVLVRGGSAELEDGIFVSPDGRAVAYDCVDSGFCVDRGGKIARYPHAGSDPLWSATGRTVATSNWGDRSDAVDVVDLATGKKTVVAPLSTYIGVVQTPLAWSPDGKRLLYQRICQVELPIPCTNAAYVRTIASGAVRRVSVDGLRWTLARWRGTTITYVTQP